MTRKKPKMVIRKTVNLTASMRKEREAETFEEMSTATSKETSSSTSTRQKRKLPENRTIKIQKERIVRYEADLVSGYEKTSDTKSMDSIPELEDIEEFEKKCEQANYIGPQIIPMKFVTTDVETPVQAIFVSDFELCELMHHPKPNSTQSKKVEFAKRFEVEQKFLEELVTDIEKLLVSSGRMDVELKVIKTRDENGTPRGKISLVRKMKAEKQGENLINQRGLYGFEPTEVLTEGGNFDKGNFGKEKTMKKNHKEMAAGPSGINMYRRFKRLFGY
ncbi:unnamed protein product [Caenorhabditis brenneri]